MEAAELPAAAMRRIVARPVGAPCGYAAARARRPAQWARARAGPGLVVKLGRLPVRWPVQAGALPLPALPAAATGRAGRAAGATWPSAPCQWALGRRGAAGPGPPLGPCQEGTGMPDGSKTSTGVPSHGPWAGWPFPLRVPPLASQWLGRRGRGPRGRGPKGPSKESGKKEAPQPHPCAPLWQ
jgi:hypothetical protein